MSHIQIPNIPHPPTHTHTHTCTYTRMDLHMQAACMLKIKKWSEARELCDKILEEEPGHAKALYRRAQAGIEMQEFETVCIQCV